MSHRRRRALERSVQQKVVRGKVLRRRARWIKSRSAVLASATALTVACSGPGAPNGETDQQVTSSGAVASIIGDQTCGAAETRGSNPSEVTGVAGTGFSLPMMVSTAENSG
jgi:hypothetical protein